VRSVRALDTASILVASLLFLLITRAHAAPIAAVAAAITLLGAIPRGGLRADTLAQIATSLTLGTGAGYLSVTLRNPEEVVTAGRLDAIPNHAAIAALAAVCARPWFAVARPSGLATSGLLLLALVTLGQGQRDLRYAGLCLLAMTLSLAARARERRPDGPEATPRPRELATLLALLAIAVAGTLAGRTALPAAYRWSFRRMIQSYGRGQSASGLSDHLRLEAMDGMLQSDTVVLRVRGARTDYLRGAAFDRYRVGAWSFRRESERRPLRVAQRAWGVSQGEVEIRRLGGPTGWVLLPLEARSIATTDGELEALSSGVVRSPRESSTVWFRPEGPRQVPIDPPRAEDTEVPSTHRRILTGLLSEWGCSTGELAVRTACIEHALRTRYRYDLHVPESAGSEPLMAFLLVHRRGHCEYFATAMTLLARAAGAPARVAVGYRVTEHSEWGDYAVVRERNAHAWTEVHLPTSGWTRFDATASSSDALNARRRVARWRTFLDAVRWRLIDAFDRARAGSGLAWAAAVLVFILGGSVLRRNLRAWRGARKGSSDGPSPGLRALIDALARADVVRSRGESLERWAARVGEGALSTALATEVREILLRYAAARYGGTSDPSLEETLRALARRVTEGSTRGASGR
jgi:hypothetical protein